MIIFFLVVIGYLAIGFVVSSIGEHYKVVSRKRYDDYPSPAQIICFWPFFIVLLGIAVILSVFETAYEFVHKSIEKSFFTNDEIED